MAAKKRNKKSTSKGAKRITVTPAQARALKAVVQKVARARKSK